MERVFPEAYIVRVIDGDTVILDIDLGYHCWQREQSHRLAGCNAWEKASAAGAAALANLAALLPVGLKVSVRVVKPDKFGDRYDAFITLPDGRDLTALLIAEQWVAAWDGRGVRPLPPWPRTIGS